MQRFTPDAQILRRREYESKLDTIKCHVHETQKLGARAEWELRVGDKQQLMDLVHTLTGCLRGWPYENRLWVLPLLKR